jgi:hypothetical protein
MRWHAPTGRPPHRCRPYLAQGPNFSAVVDMPRGRPSPELAATNDANVQARVEAPARAERAGDSALMPEPARRALKLKEGLAGVAEWEAENGTLTQAELAAARERVGGLSARRSP